MSSQHQSQLADFESLLESLPAAHQQRTLGKSLNQAASTVDAANQSIVLLEGIIPLAIELGDSFDTEGRSEVARCLEQLYSAAQIAIDAQTQEQLMEVNTKWHTVKPACDRLRIDFVRAFKSLQKREFGSIGPLGQILKKLPETSKIGESLANIGKQALGLELPIAQTDLNNWRKLLQLRDEIRQSLLDMGFSDEVQLFLNAVANDEASLSDLTPEVLTWLTERKATSSFRISL